MAEQPRTLVRKVPGGKLFRLDVIAAERIQQVRITGDFFLHPEDALPAIEDCMAAAALPVEPNGLVGCIQETLREHNASLIGVTPEDLAFALAEVLA